MTDLRTILAGILAAACIVLGVASCASTTMLKATRASLTTTTKALNDQTARLEAQKKAAAAQLATLNASIRAQQARLDATHTQQEKTDATHVQTVDGLRADLRAVRLQLATEATRRWSSGAAGSDPIAAFARAGAAGGAQAPGLLPGQEDLEAEEDGDTYDADVINLAYRSCRADAMSVRQPQTPP